MWTRPATVDTADPAALPPDAVLRCLNTPSSSPLSEEEKSHINVKAIKKLNSDFQACHLKGLNSTACNDTSHIERRNNSIFSPKVKLKSSYSPFQV